LFHPPAANGFLSFTAKLFSVLNRATYWYDRLTRFSMSAWLRSAACSGLAQSNPNVPAIDRIGFIIFIFYASLSL
jgi:hypothetical protein